MKIIKAAIAISALVIPAAAVAHPLNVPFASHGECEAEKAKNDRSHGTDDLESGTFETRGEANRWMHETFRCEQFGDAWYIVRN